MIVFFFQAEDGIRDSVASLGLGDVYKGPGFLEAPLQICTIFVGRGGPDLDLGPGES